MTLRVVHCAEDALAAGASRHLLDRVVRERAPDAWLRELWSDSPEAARTFVGLDGQQGWSDRGAVKRDRRFKFHPRKQARPLKGWAGWGYVCARLAAVALEPTDESVLLLAHDTDGGQDSALEGVRAAAVNLPTLVASANPEFDAWVVAGFEPRDATEQTAHREVCQVLRESGRDFDPVARPHELTSNVESDVRDAKTICRRLLGLDHQAAPEDSRVQDCLDADLDLLEARGREAGIADFVGQIERTLFPVLGSTPLIRP